MRFFPKFIDRAITYLKSEPAPVLTKHQEAQLLPTQVSAKATQYRTTKYDSDKAKKNSADAKIKGKIPRNTSRLERFKQWGKNRITDSKSAIEKTNNKLNIAGWGHGTVSISKLVSLKRSTKVTNILGFKTNFTLSFFDYKSATIDKPVVRLAAYAMSEHDLEIKKKELTAMGLNEPLEIEFKTPTPKHVHLPESIKTEIEEAINENNQIFISDIKKTKGRYIPGATASTHNGPLAESEKRILEHLKCLKDADPNIMTGSPDENMKILSLAIISVAIDEDNNYKGDSSKLLYVGRCVKALDAMKELSLENSIIRPAATSEASLKAPFGNTEHVDLAWRIAYKLAETQMGFDLLKLITATPVDNTPQNLSQLERTNSARKKIRQDANMRLFMQGASKLMAANEDVSQSYVDPTSLIKYCVEKTCGDTKISNTLLIKALPGLQYAMREESGAADLENYKTAWDDEISKWDRDPLRVNHTIFKAAEEKKKVLKNVSKSTWAVNALRNGFDTNAPGSEFDKANKRLEKVSIQLTRALQAKGIEVDDRDKEAAAAIDSQTLLRPWLKPSKLSRKSAFNNSLFFDIATNGALIQREKMHLASRLLEKFLSGVGDQVKKETTTELHFKKVNNTDPGFNFTRFEGALTATEAKANKMTASNVAKIVMLRSWIGMPQSENISGYSLSPEEIFKDEGLKFLGAMFDVDMSDDVPKPPGSLKFFQQIRDELKALAPSCLTPKLLGDWATEAGLKRPVLEKVKLLNNLTRVTDENRPIPTADEVNDMPAGEYPSNFFDALDHLINGMDNENISHVNYTKQGTINYMKAQIERMRLGSSIKMTDGAALGFGLQGTFSALSRAGTALIASGRASFSSRFGRVAEMDIGVNAVGGFARFGVQTDQRTRAGGGGSIGWRIGKKSAGFKAGLSAAADVKAIADADQFEGVGLRLDRLGGDITGRVDQVAGVAGDAAMTKNLSELVEKVMKGRRSPSGDTAIPDGMLENYSNSTLLEQLLEGEDGTALSVSWIDKKNSGTRTTGISEQISGIGGIHADGIGGAALSGTAGTSQTVKTQHQEELTGALRSRFISTGYSVVGTLQASATLGLQNTEIGNDPALAKVGFTAAELVSAEAEVFRAGVTSDIRTVELNGVLQPRTYMVISHANAKSFIDKVKQPENLTRWSHAFAKIKNPVKYNPETKEPGRAAADRIEVVNEQREVVRDLLKEAADNADPNIYHIEYLEMKPDITEQINRYRALAIMSRKVAELTHQNQAAVFDAAAESLLNNKNSYSERFLFSIQKSSFEEGKKMNFVGSFQSTSKVQATTMTNKGFWG
ncbi:hypothetical protein [Actimicrobium antarcticum]|uniref:Uncharacterized protein n=1 Tax=Actimicrobium antarcticum TaxID=1051899 RepID=A0ABP7SUF1_9BURK